jgi:hypothetical protein
MYNGWIRLEAHCDLFAITSLSLVFGACALGRASTHSHSLFFDAAPLIAFSTKDEIVVANLQQAAVAPHAVALNPRDAAGGRHGCVT